MDKLRQNFEISRFAKIRITQRSKNIINQFCLVRECLIKYPVQSDRDTSDLTNHTQIKAVTFCSTHKIYQQDTDG